MNNLREIKKNRLLKDEAFTFVICSDDRTNSLGADVVYLTNFYDINFGGFSEPYDDYRVEVVSFGAANGFPNNVHNYYYFACEGLANNGYFCSNKVLPSNDVILSVLPLTALQDAYIQTDGNIIFNVKNCRIVKKVRFKFYKQDFSIPGPADLNGSAEIKWVLTLRMTPIVNDY